MRLLVTFISLFAACNAWSGSEPSCPLGMTFTTMAAGRGACFFEAIQLPNSGFPRAACKNFSEGYLGFMYNHNAENNSYQCPIGLHSMSNGDGQKYCITWIRDLLPKNAMPECQRLSQGQLGFSWLL